MDASSGRLGWIGSGRPKRKPPGPPFILKRKVGSRVPRDRSYQPHGPARASWPWESRAARPHPLPPLYNCLWSSYLPHGIFFFPTKGKIPPGWKSPSPGKSHGGSKELRTEEKRGKRSWEQEEDQKKPKKRRGGKRTCRRQHKVRILFSWFSSTSNCLFRLPPDLPFFWYSCTDL